MSYSYSRAIRLLARIADPSLGQDDAAYEASSEPASAADLESLDYVVTLITDRVALIEDVFTNWAPGPIRGRRGLALRCRDAADLLTEFATALDELEAGRSW